MSILQKIQELVLNYINGISVNQFRNQFVPLFAAINESRPEGVEASPLANKIESLFADLSEGVINEAQFRDRLLQTRPIVVVMEAAKVEWRFSVSSAHSGSSSSNLEQSITWAAPQLVTA